MASRGTLELLLGSLANRRIHILMYHAVSDDLADPWGVSATAFAEQMKWLQKNGYRVVSLREAIDALQEKRPSRKQVVLTFDDGHADFVENALPILREYRFPATLFVVAGLAGAINYWNRPELHKPLLDWRGMREVVQSGCSVASHGMKHSDLPALSRAELEDEVATSKKIIEEKLGEKVDAFSYPWGRYGEREILALQRAGYRCAVTVASAWGNGPDTDSFRLERETVSRKDSIADFAAKLSGVGKALRSGLLPGAGLLKRAQGFNK